MADIQDEPDITYSIVKFEDSQERPVGVGFAVGENLVVTCAHVVNLAIARPIEEQSRPTGTRLSGVSLPLSDGPWRTIKTTAEVIAWSPPVRVGFGPGDIACLRLIVEDPTLSVPPVRLANPENSRGELLDLFGYPVDPPRPQGAWAQARLLNKVGGGLWQLDRELQSAHQIQPGYSGGPLWHRARRSVVGMLVVAPRTGSPSGDSYAISSEALLHMWPKAIDASNLGGVIHPDITVVQLNSRRGRATAVTTIKRPPQASFAACSRAISRLGWKLRGSDDSLRLSAQTRWEWRSFAARMDLAISRERDFSKLNIDLRPIVKTTIYDFGLAKSHVLRFLVALGDELKSLDQ